MTLAAVGLTLGVLGGVATHVGGGDTGVALARVDWIAGGHGFEPAVRRFSIARQIGAAAWPVALVLMALIEVGARIAVVQVRGRRLVTA